MNTEEMLSAMAANTEITLTTEVQTDVFTQLAETLQRHQVFSSSPWWDIEAIFFRRQGSFVIQTSTKYRGRLDEIVQQVYNEWIEFHG